MDRRAAAVAAAVLFLAGCGGDDSTTIEVPDSSGGTIRMEAGEPGKVALPSNFPKDIPVAKDSTVAMSMAKGKDLVVSFQAKGSATDLAAFFEKGLKAEGWTLDDTVVVNGVSAAITGKKGARSCSIVVSGENDEAFVQVSTTTE